ncbi:MAG: EAL domain-containing protein [Sutterellaceae bacterium]|nr:EAL domain-containing protein [Burkholderiaceae bacterium]MCX7901855.1 EAL domain-containing protein [Burkholderiaceae bacterium]MDW8429625.1 EAL domain-containing protein [Sutterellaceae bacterium]
MKGHDEILVPDDTPAALTRVQAALTEAIAAAGAAHGVKEALHAILQRLCRYGSWPIGHALAFRDGAADVSLWQVTTGMRADELVAASETLDFAHAADPFVSQALRTGEPCWIADLRTVEKLPRAAALRAAGLRCGLAVPLSADGEPVALLEFFAADVRAPDRWLLRALPSVTPWLARVVARASATQDLHEGAQQMRRVVDHVPAMIAYFDTDLRCRYANRRYCEFYGIDAERVQGMTLCEIMGGDLDGVVRNVLAQVITGKPVTARRAQPGGATGVTHIEIRCVPDLTRDEGLRGFYALLFDVSEQVHAEAALRANEERLRAILDNEPAWVTLVAADGRLLEINRAGLELLQVRSLQEAQAYGLEHFVLEPHREGFRALLARTLAGERCMREYEIAGARGTRRWVETHTALMPCQGAEPPAILAVTRDITERKAAEARITRLTYYDPITGLPNRASLQLRLEEALQHAAGKRGRVAVLALQLDRFVEINNELGGAAGEALLQEAAARLLAATSGADLVSRLEGGEFVVLLAAVGSEEQATGMAERLLASLSRPFIFGGQEVFVSPSVGLSLSPEGGVSAQSLIETAEIALSRAQRDGGQTFRRYEPGGPSPRGQRLSLEARLRRALKHEGFVLHYQPRACLATSAITGVEALLRLQDTDGQPIGPDRFIALAEETGLILPIGEWVLHTACAQAAAWRAAGHPIRVAVNLSVRQFRQPDLASRVAAAAAANGLPMDQLELEITETAAMSHPEQAITVLRQLRELGVALAVDDFGTGYSSLSYLQRLPIQRVKIDRAFVRDLTQEGRGVAIARVILALARTLDLRTTAEGVETGAQRDFLAAHGCEEYQGYLLSAPLPAPQLTAWLAAARDRETPVVPDNCPKAVRPLRLSHMA